MSRIITLALNPAIDTTVFTDGLEREKINSVISERTDAAGKTANIARIFCSFGITQQFISLAGTDNAEKYFSMLSEEFPSLSPEIIRVPGAIRENLHFILPDESLVTVRRNGFSVNRDTVDKILSRLSQAVTENSLVIMNGRFPDGFSKENFREILSIISSCGGKTVIDSNSVSADDLSDTKPYLIKPNIDELRELTGLPLTDMRQILESLESLHSSGIKHILLSRGPLGVIYYGDDGVFRAVPPKIKALSTVGAGDSTLAGFIISRISGDSITDSVKKAVAFGSAAVLLPGTQVPLRKDVDEIFEKTVVSQL